MQLINQIRSEFNSLDGIEPQAAAELAKRYHVEVKALNERLLVCVDLLRKGLRSEAIQQSSLNPDALTLASELEFPEVEEWVDVLRFLDIVPPARVNRDAVLQINEAIVETQPIESLLKNHRRLAIAKAPLNMRLKVLRRIAQLDATNPVWEEDIEKWEKEREKQIPQEFEIAKRDTDRHTIDRLYDETHRENWIAQIDVRIQEEIKNLKEEYEHQDSIAALTKLAEQLHVAFAEFDGAAARNLCDSWNEIKSTMKMPVPIELASEAEPVFAWLSSQEAEQAQEADRAMAIDHLESLMNTKTDLDVLERAYAKATRFERAIPIQTEQRYRGIIEQLQLRSRRKIQLLVTSVVATSMVIAIVIALQINRAITTQKISDASTELQEMISAGRINDASSYLDSLGKNSLNVYESEPIQAHLATVTQLIEEEAERVATFNSYILQADNTDPVLINLSILTRAEKLAKTPTEQSRVDSIRFRWDAWNREQIEDQTNAAMEIIFAIQEKLSNTEQFPIAGSSIRELDDIVTQLDSLASKYPKREASTDARVLVLRNKAISLSSSIADTMQKRSAAEAAEKAILTAPSLTALATALDRYADDIMSGSLSRELKRAALDQSLWGKTTQIQEFLESGRKSGLDKFTTLDLEELDQQFADLEMSLNLGVNLQDFELLSELVELHRSRDGLLTELEDRLALSPMAELLTVVPEESQQRFFTFYVTWLNAKKRIEEADPSERHGIDKLVDINGAVNLEQVQLPVTFIQEPRNTIKWLSKEIRDERFDILINWRDPLLKLIAAVHQRPQLDGHIKEEITREILISCCDGLGIEESSLNEVLEKLEDRQETSERWFEPTRVNDKLPDDCKDWLTRDLSDAYGRPNESMQELLRLFKRRWIWIGTLWRNQAGDVVLRSRETEEINDGKCYVVQKSLDGTGKPEIIYVGDWRENQFQFAEKPVGVMAGRPIFVLTSP